MQSTSPEPPPRSYLRAAENLGGRPSQVFRHVFLPLSLPGVGAHMGDASPAEVMEVRLIIEPQAAALAAHRANSDDLAEIEDILKLLMELNGRGITVILIEHIMSAVMSFSQRLVVLVSGRKIADGNPAEVVRNPEVEKAYIG